MNYKLAKQLKDAGFPQDKVKFYYVFPPKCVEGYTNIMEISRPQGMLNLLAVGYEIVACPSLEELIDACGDDFEALIKQAGSWVAISNKESYILKQNFECVKTKKEAVVKLFIKLNGK